MSVNHLAMKHLNLTQAIRTTLACDARAEFNEVHLLLSVYEQHGLLLTPAQKAVTAGLPSPASVVRIANREKKRRPKKENRL